MRRSRCLAGRLLPKRSFAATFWHLFHAKVDKDLIFINQIIIKDTIKDLITKQELPATAKSLTITTPRTSRIYANVHAYVSASVKSIVQLVDSVLWLRDDRFNKDKTFFFAFIFYYSMPGLLIKSSPVRGLIFSNRLKDQVCMVNLDHPFSFNLCLQNQAMWIILHADRKTGDAR